MRVSVTASEAFRGGHRIAVVGACALLTAFGSMGLLSAFAQPVGAQSPVLLYVDGTQGTSASGCTAPGSAACTTIQDGINAAESYGDSDVTIDVAAAVYTENDTLDVPATDTLTIEGSGSSTTTVSGGNSGSVLDVSAGTVTIEGLTISDGSDATGGGIDNYGNTTLTDDVVSSDSSPTYIGEGGGIYNGGTMTLTGDTITGDSANDFGHGGGIFNTGSITLSDDTISNDSAQWGAGLENDGSATLSDDTMSNDAAQTGGGAVYSLGGGVGDEGNTVFTDDTFTSDTAVNGGGIANAGATDTLDNDVVSNDDASSEGGGFYNYNSNLNDRLNVGDATFENDTFSNDTAESGGGLENDYATLTSTDDTISGNSSITVYGYGGGGVGNLGGNISLTADSIAGNISPDNGGGGVRSGGLSATSGNGTATLTDDTISNNSAEVGGGVWIDGTATLSDDTISGDFAEDSGGGVYNDGVFSPDNVTLTNDTLTDDSVEYEGGGAMVNAQGGAASLTEDTISSDSAAYGYGGGVWDEDYGTATIANSIMDAAPCGQNISPIIDGGYNVESDDSCGLGATDRVNDPDINLAGSLAANGSSGPQTLAIGTNSSAFEEVPATECTITTDERGDARPGISGTNCDAGAFEYQVQAPNQTPTSVTTALAGGTQAGTVITVPEGTPVTDSATLSGADAATAGGTVLYSVFSDSSCTKLTGSGGTVVVTDGVVPPSNPVSLLSQGTYYWQASYSGDATDAASLSACGAEVDTTTPPTPTSTSTSLAGGGQSGPTITVPEYTAVTDAATLSGANASTAGGTVAYNVYSDSLCTDLAGSGGTVAVTDGVVPPSDPVTLPTPGTYYWLASYSGDLGDSGSDSGCGSEVEVVVPPAPTSTMTSLSGGGQSGAAITVPPGTAVTDSATLAGANASTAGGYLTYNVYSDDQCTVPAGYYGGAVLVADGVAGASYPVTINTPGTYYWQASYLGDPGDQASTSTCGSEVETVASQSAAQLVFSTEPPLDATPGSSFDVAVSAEDSSGNLLSGDDTDQVTLAIAADTGTPGASLDCTPSNPLTVSSGVAQFSCSINDPGAGYELIATSGTLPAVTSSDITVATSFVTAVSPNLIGQGASDVPVTITGFGFGSSERVLGPAGVTFTHVAELDGETLTAVVSASPSAVTGVGAVTVVQRGGQAISCTSCLTVDAAPTVTSLSPPTLQLGSSDIPVTVTGTGFTSSATNALSVSMSGPSTAVTAVVSGAVSPTSFTMLVSAPVTAKTGQYSLSISNGDYGVGACRDCLRVEIIPSITSVTPSDVGQGALVATSITGANFTTGAKLTSSNPSVTFSVVRTVNADEITAKMAVASTAPLGPVSVTVADPRQGSATEVSAITVDPAPHPTSLSPDSEEQGTTSATVDIKGSNFVSKDMVKFSGTGVTDAVVANIGSTDIELQVSVSKAASVSKHSVTVTNPDGGTATCTNCFSVTKR